MQEGDLRTTGNVKEVVKMVLNQKDFDLLFDALLSNERSVVMRAADAIEKITIAHPDYLEEYKKDVLKLFSDAKHIELKWHIAQLIPRLQLNRNETIDVWKQLYSWAENQKESRIVRVNSMQTLFEISKRNPDLIKSFNKLVTKVEQEHIPSLLARLKKIQKGPGGPGKTI